MNHRIRFTNDVTVCITKNNLTFPCSYYEGEELECEIHNDMGNKLTSSPWLKPGDSFKHDESQLHGNCFSS